MSTIYFVFLLGFIKFSYSESVSTPKPQGSNREIIGETRRIINGHKIVDTKPYMVYLRPTRVDNYKVDSNWVCGGVIISERYIITSAACIEDVTYFYVVSGTHRWVPPTETNECIENGALRAVSKCIPRTYSFDGNYFNNIRWMVNDIAVVRTEDPFNFYRRIKGCDFIPQFISYNNISKDLEAPGRDGFIAGWGSTERYIDAFDKSPISHNSPFLMEAQTVIIEKSKCKRSWDRRYHAIIDNYMICGQRISTKIMTGECEEHATCRDLVHREESVTLTRRFQNDPDKLILHSLAEVREREKIRKRKTRRYGIGNKAGGFCENDHGGPLVVGYGRNRLLLGVISAYLTKNDSKKCFGPYLYTSVYDNRFLIECALYKELKGNKCDTVLRDESAVLEEETFNWGPLIPRSYLYENEETVPENGESKKVADTERSDNETSITGGKDTPKNTNTAPSSS